MTPPNPQQRPQQRPSNPKGNPQPHPNAGPRPNPITAPPTWKSINKEVRGATNTRYRPVERAEGKELRASNQRNKQLGGWWNSYLQTVAQGQQADQAAYQQAGQEAQGFMDQASARDSANTGALQQEAAQSAAVRGAPVNTEAAGREQAAQAQRNYLAGAYGAHIALQGANDYSYLTAQHNIGARQKISSHQEESRRTRGVEADRKKTREERGEFATVERGKKLEGARNYQIQRAATGLEKQKAKLSAAEAAREARLEAEKNRRENEEQRNENAKTRREGSGGSGGLTPDTKRAIREGKQNAAAEAHALYTAAKKKPKSAAEWAAFGHVVAEEPEISPANAHWAVKRLRERVEARETTKTLHPHGF